MDIDRYKYLMKYDIEPEYMELIIAGSMWYEKVGGTSVTTSYQGTVEQQLREEYFLLANTVFGLANIAGSPSANKIQEKFDGAYLFFTKLTGQSVRAVDLLATNQCNFDAISIVRSLHSRVNLLILFSLSPELFAVWLRDPKKGIWLDGSIRNELDAHGIHLLDHMYSFSSEIIHNQSEALENVGFLEKGLFPENTTTNGMVYIYAKLLLAIFAYTFICLSLELMKDGGYGKVISAAEKGITGFLDDVLSSNRYEHLFVTLAEDRHWKKVGKDKYQIGSYFSFSHFRDQVTKFHRSAGQRKSLGKKYRVNNSGEKGLPLGGE